MNIEVIARVAHEANAAFCRSIGDNSQPEWGSAPEWQRKSCIDGVLFHLAELKRGSAPSPSATHDKWLLDKAAVGWKHGPVKDAEKKEHPCLVPYEMLPAEQKSKDYIFGAIVKAFFDLEKEFLED